MRTDSIHTRLAIGTALVFAFSAVVTCVELFVLHEQVDERLQAQLQGARIQLRGMASVLAVDSDTLRAVGTGDLGESRRLLAEFRGSGVADAVVVYRPDGTVFADAARPGHFGQLDALSWRARAASAGNEAADVVAERGNRPFLFHLRPLRSPDGRGGVLAVGLDLGELVRRPDVEKSTGLRNIRVVPAESPRTLRDPFTARSLGEHPLPAGLEFRAEIADLNRHLLRAGVRLAILLLAFYAFARVWIRSRTAKEQLRNEELRRISSDRLVALGQMSAGIAHEINNPLAIIQAGAKQLELQLSEWEPWTSDSLQICEMIDRTTLRISRIVNGLRTFARDGAQDPKSSTRLDDIVRDTLEICAARFRSSDVKVLVDLGESEHTVNCRSVQISQVLLNLLNNSFDAIENTAEPWISVELHRSQGHLELWITDSGKGIPKNIRGKVMEPFFTTKPVGKGTGIGLSIARGIMENHDGSLFIDPGCANTRFVMRLPV